MQIAVAQTPNAAGEAREALWRAFEGEVAESVAALDLSAKVRRNVKRRGVVSGAERQIDVFVEGMITQQRMSIVIECKRYKRPVGIGTVDEFAGKLLDLAPERGILYSWPGGHAGGCTAGGR